MWTITNLFRNTLMITILILTISATGATAAIFTVNQTTDAGDLTCDATCTLRDAIDDANNLAGADTITFDPAVFSTPQTITLAGAVLTINDVGNALLTINGPGASLLTVSGNNIVRVFAIESGDTASISGMTVTQGNSETGSLAGHGGGIVNNGTLTIMNVVVTGNTARFSGGGIAVFGSGTLNVINSTISNNTARVTSASATTGGGGGGIINFNGGSTVNISGSIITGNTSVRGGGGVYNVTSTLNVTDSTISNNIANTTSDSDSGGGGIINFFGVMTITNSIISGNEARAIIDDFQLGRGGGIFINPGNSLTTITNSTITGNRAFSSGGGISYLDNGAVTGVFLSITNSTISNNISNSDNNRSGGGGGLFLTGSGSVAITGSTINGNTANTGAAGSSSGGGGGINFSLSLTMTNSTISGNNAGRSGGGIFTPGSSTTITGSTIVNNTATINGGGVAASGTTNPVNFRNTIVANNTDNGIAPDIFGTVNSQGYNLFENTTGTTVTGDTTTNITGQDPNLGHLQNNGGMTFTHALLTNSPAIDKGNSFGLTTDQRGMTRPIDNPSIPNAAGGDGADIGAFEVQPATTGASVLVGGRVMTINGRGIRNVVVTMTDSQGNVRTTTSTSFGYFRFDDVTVGETYVLSVRGKRFYFLQPSQVLSINEQVNDINFIGYIEEKRINIIP